MNFCITGATSGLGRFLLEKLLRNSNYNFFLISRNKEELKIIKDKYPSTKIYHANLSDLNTTKEIANKIVEESGGKIDVFICNAAEGSFGFLSDIPVENFIKDINVNYLSHLILIKAFYPLMVSRNFGHIINISSGTAIFGLKSTSSYSASKSSIQNLIEVIYFENLNKNIFPKNIFPGSIDTNFDKKNKHYGKFEETSFIRKKNTEIIANKIVKNIFSKKLNIFYQPSPMISFVLKTFPFLEKWRRFISD